MGVCHARAYKQVEQVELVAAVDPLAAARDQFRQNVGVRQVFATTEEMLAAVQPDLVSVCTWHPLHPTPTVAAARAGVKGIICEKPMAISLGAADEMLSACAEARHKAGNRPSAALHARLGTGPHTRPSRGDW